MEEEVVVVGQEEVGLLLRTELGQGVGAVGEEVQVVLGQHLVSKTKQIDCIKDLEKKDLASTEILVLLLSVRDINTGKDPFYRQENTASFSRKEAFLLNALKILHNML